MSLCREVYGFSLLRCICSSVRLIAEQNLRFRGCRRQPVLQPVPWQFCMYLHELRFTTNTWRFWNSYHEFCQNWYRWYYENVLIWNHCHCFLIVFLWSNNSETIKSCQECQASNSQFLILFFSLSCFSKLCCQDVLGCLIAMVYLNVSLLISTVESHNNGSNCTCPQQKQLFCPSNRFSIFILAIEEIHL